MNELLNKNAILVRLELERSAFDSIVDQVDPELIDSLPVEDNRTVKDILAHICSWEIELLRWLDMAEHGIPPDIPAPGTWSEYTDQFNAIKYEANRNRQITDVKDEYEQVHIQLCQALSVLPDNPHDPYWSMWYGNRPPWQLLATFYEHYRDHKKPLRASLHSALTTKL